MRKVAFGLAGIGLLALLTWGAIQVAKPGPGAQAAVAKPPPALEFRASEVTRPALVTMKSRLEFSGPVVAPFTVVVKSRAQGVLEELRVMEGSPVRAGDLIGRIDPADVNSRVAERAAYAEQTRATLQQAQIALRQAEQMHEEVFISRAQLDNARAQWATAQAQHEAALASLSTVRLSLRENQLQAPIDGVVLRRHAVAGEKVGFDQPVVTVVDPARLELHGIVGAHQVGRVPLLSQVDVSVEGRADRIEGKVLRIAAAAEAGSRAITVVVGLPNPSGLLRAGEYASAALVLEDPQPRLTLPIAALVANGPDAAVWLIRDGQLVRRPVVVGRRDAASGRAEILQGVAAEDIVLALRFENLRDGAPAKVLDGPRVTPDR